MRKHTWGWIGLGCLALLVGGCAAKRELELSEAELRAARVSMVAAQAAAHDAAMGRLLARVKSEQAAHEAGRVDEAPVIDVLVISGGGDWGAFGAGVLKGWGRVEGELARPRFDVVTGVSTGALIAPFAYLGTDADIETIVGLYRDPGRDWVKRRGGGPLFLLPSNVSLATIPGLERTIREALPRQTIERIAATRGDGRMLAVNTTNLDLGMHRAFDLVAAAERSLREGDDDLVADILCASSAVPAVFPPREIEGWMYVDGMVSGSILYGGRQREGQTFPARWRAAYPDAPMPRIRYWVIFNGEMVLPMAVTERRWPTIMERSQWLSSQQATIESLRHLFTMAALARAKYGEVVEVRVIAVPDGWKPTRSGTFQKQTMNDLADLGERLGADSTAWRTGLP